MDWQQIEKNWTRFKQAIREKWGKLTEEDLEAIAGRRKLAKYVSEGLYRSADASRISVPAAFPACSSDSLAQAGHDAHNSPLRIARSVPAQRGG